MNEVDKILTGRLPDGTRVGTGLWDQKSVDFIKSNVTETTPIKTLTPLANDDGTFTHAEIQAVKNSKEPSIDGISKSDFDGIYNRSYNEGKTQGLTDSQARKKASVDAANATKVKSLDYLDVEYSRNPTTGQVNKVDVGNKMFADVPAGPKSTPISDLNPTKGSVAKSVDGEISEDNWNALKNGEDQISKQQGFKGFDPDPATHGTGDVPSGAAKAGIKALHGLGVIGDVAALALAIGAANDAWAAGDKTKAANIVGIEVAGIIGGTAGAMAAGVIAATLLPALGVGAGVGVIAAAVAGGFLGDAAAREAWDKALDVLGDMGLVPKGGIEGLLDDFGWALDNPGAIYDELPPWIQGPLGILGLAPGVGGSTLGGGADPLVLDLNGNGKIDMVSVENGVYFDFWQDGFAEKNGWVAPGDGFLVFDKDKDGLIEGYEEMIGAEHTLSYITDANELPLDTNHGFFKLEAFDTNQDRILDAKDAGYAQLKVWQDRNMDGISQANELKTLAQMKIKSIDLKNVTVDPWFGSGNAEQIEGNFITHSSTYTMTNGETRKIVDAWLSHDLMDARNTQDYTLDPKVLFLPTLRGFGTLPDLHISMSTDKKLLSMVEAFASKRDFPGLFQDFAAVENEVKAMLFQWAGVPAKPAPTLAEQGYAGVFALMPEYHFLKKFMGLDNDVVGMWFDERPFAPMTWEGIEAISESFNTVLQNLTAQLVYQVGGRELFEAGNSFDPFSADFYGTFRLSSDSVNALKTAASRSSDKVGFWHNVAKMLDSTMGIESLNRDERFSLNNAIKTTAGNNWSWSKIVSTLEEQDFVRYDYVASQNGTRWDDHLYVYDSEAKGVRLNGGNGDDRLEGGRGDDFLRGGAGNDFLTGDDGNDTYFYDSGHDVINTGRGLDYGYSNVIQFASGMKPSDVSLKVAFSDAPLGYATQTYLDIKGKGTITIFDDLYYWTYMSQQIDYLKFADGTKIKFADMAPSYLGSAENNNFWGPGWNKAVKIYGFNGDDRLNGTDANETMYGGAGDDYMYGGKGNDTYVYDYGHDTIDEYITEGNDILVLGKGIKLSDISIEKTKLDPYEPGNMLIRVAGRGSITIKSQDYSNGVETLKLADGTRISLVDFWQGRSVEGTDQNDNLTGRDSSSYTLQDILIGGLGDDTLNGKKGNDILDGGDGDDTYIVGDGMDAIVDSGGIDRLVFNSSYNLNNFSYSVAVDNAYLDILYDGALAARIMLPFYPNAAIEYLEVVGKGFIDLTTLVHDQVGSDEHEIIAGIGYGGSINNRIYGMDGNDHLYGYEGDDYLNGGRDIDYLSGGNGNDILVGGLDADALDGGDGVDMADYLDATYSVSVNLQNPSSNTGFAEGDTYYSIENIRGSKYSDNLRGDNSNNSIWGHNGNDIIEGRGGKDTLYGQNGNDLLFGGAGNDTLYGGSGADIFYFIKGQIGIDKIMDFKKSQGDKIDISSLLDAYDPLSDAITNFVQITTSGSNSILKVDMNGGGDSFVQIATIQNVVGLADEASLVRSGHLIV